jgi:guanylate kinase
MTATFVVPSPDELALVRTKAASYRLERAAYKTQIREGNVTVAAVFRAIAEGNQMVCHLRIEPFLRCYPAIGPVKAAGICAALGVSPQRRIGGLGRRQLASLRELLEERETTSGRRSSDTPLTSG